MWDRFWRWLLPRREYKLAWRVTRRADLFAVEYLVQGWFGKQYWVRGWLFKTYAEAVTHARLRMVVQEQQNRGA